MHIGAWLMFDFGFNWNDLWFKSFGTTIDCALVYTLAG
jgi:hypothetical protein